MKEKRIQVRTDLPQSLVKQLKIYAIQHNMKLYEVHEQAIRAFLNEEKHTKSQDQQDLFVVTH